MKVFSWLALIAASIATTIGAVSDLAHNDHSFWAGLAMLGAVVGFIVACWAHCGFVEERR